MKTISWTYRERNLVVELSVTRNIVDEFTITSEIESEQGPKSSGEVKIPLSEIGMLINSINFLVNAME